MSKQPEKVLIEATVCFPITPTGIWLPKKALSKPPKEKKIGEGFRNGYGGGIELGETPLQCAMRELEEESGIRETPDHFRKVAIMHFHNTNSDNVTFICTVHVFLVETENTPQEIPGQNMIDPQHYVLANLPLSEMMPADQKWLPPVLDGKLVHGKAYYGPGQKKLLRDVELEFVLTLPER